MPGPPPTSAKLRLLKGKGPGTDSSGRKVGRQPQDVPFLPDAPSHLPPLAREQWDHVCAGLRRMEIAGPVDVAVLEAFCLAYQDMRDAADDIACRGLWVTGSAGQQVANPMLNAAAKARGQIGTLGGQLGLTPAGRLRMTLPEKESSSDEEALFGGG